MRVHTADNLEHALLYSIGVNLPAHRVGQLDRVIVLASPINDINLNAWDLNRVKSFVESDVGIRMDICPSCIRGVDDRITFIMEKRFIKDCIQFLVREARVTTAPQSENGLLIYHVAHQCGYIKPPDMPAPEPPPLPPPYTPEDESRNSSSLPLPRKQSVLTQSEPPVFLEYKRDGNGSTKFRSRTLGNFEPAYPRHLWDDSTSSGTGSFTGSSRAESLFLADGSLNLTTHSKKVGNDFRSYLPPRTIPRMNYESCIPARAQPYLKYQPHMYQQGMNRLEAPYQISSRIIITDSGEVQFERNIMGNMPPSKHGGFLFSKQLPLPPRGLRAPSPQANLDSSPILSRRVQVNVQSGVGFQSSEVNPNTGGHFKRQTEKLRQMTPPPSVPPRPPFNIKQERFVSSVYPGHTSHDSPPLHVPPPTQILRNRVATSTGQFESCT